MNEASASRRGRLLHLAREHLLPVGLYSVFAVVVTWPGVLRLGTHVTADLGDSLQNSWNIWWIHRALSEGRWFYWCDLQFHPNGSDLYFHTLSPASAVPAALLLFLGVSAVAAYNVVVLANLVLGGWAHCFLARRLGAARWAAIAAGAALTFGPFHVAHSAGGHFQLTGIHWLSLYLVALLTLLERPGVRHGALAGLALAMATFQSWYIVLTAGLLSLVFFGASVVGDRGRGLRAAPLWKGLATAAVVYGALAGPLLVRMISIKLTEELAPGHASWFWVGDLESLWLPNRHMALARLSEAWRSWSGNASEASTYLGYGLLGLALVGAVARRPRAILLFATALFFALLTLGPYLHTGGEIHLDVPLPYRALERHVPILGLMGCPGRFGLGAQLCLTLAAALGATWIWQRQGRLRWLGVLLPLLAVAELTPLRFPSSPLPHRPALEAMAAEEGDFAVFDTHYGNLRQLHQTLHGRPMIMGHTSRYRMALLRQVTEDPVLEQIRNPPGLLVERARRVDERVFFDWGAGRPHPDLPRDHFEVRWRGQLHVPRGGWWRFYIDEDDGCRVRIDGERVVDSWWRHRRRRVPGEARLTEGWHDLEVDYFDWRGPAVLELRWSLGDTDPEPIPASAYRVREGEPGIVGTYSARVERLPEGGRDEALSRLRQLRVRYIIKPARARAGFERRLGLIPRREGPIVIFEIP